MEDRTVRHQRLVSALRWIARIWSVASIGLMLLLLVGEGLYPSTLTEWVGLLFFPFGISAGMILAWWREDVGGGITVGSLLVFYLIHMTTTGTFPKGWGWLVCSAPGFLFLLLSYLSRRRLMSVNPVSGH